MSSNVPRVESFVVRFVQDVPGVSSPGIAPDWRGVIVHVQTNEEKTFSHFADAIAFIARYVPVGEFVFKTTADDRPQTAESGRQSVVGGRLGA